MDRSIKEALASASEIDQLDVELLLAYVLGKKREFIVANPKQPISWSESWKFEKLVKKRKRHIPLAYLTGHQAFYGLDFLVNKHTLVPRPDTEVLVERAIELLKEKKDAVLVDVGTGSACIPVAITKEVPLLTKEGLGEVKTYATDISRRALRMAKKNAKRHNANITFLHGNLLEPIISRSPFPISHSPLVITANLPYLTEEQFAGEISIQKEPKSALVAAENGLALIRELLEQIQYAKITNATILLEYDPSQTTTLKKLVKNIFPNANVKIQKDLAGRDRVCEVSL